VIGRLARGAGDLDIAVAVAASSGQRRGAWRRRSSASAASTRTPRQPATSVDPDLAPTTVAALVQ